MAQLSDDCFAFGGDLMRIEDAAALIARNLRPEGDAERVEIGHADGRILAADLLATFPIPPFTNSAVDGYAVRHADLAGASVSRFRVTDRVEAGALASGAIGQGEAIRIFTGAPMPDGADTVFMQEDVRIVDKVAVELPSGLKCGANVRPAGEDIAQGSLALARGQRLRPQDIALAAALGQTHLTVARRLRVAVFSTGNELVSPGQALRRPQLYDSNRFMLAALLRRLGCDVSDLGILRDEPLGLAQALKQAARDHDLIVTSGGVSTGEADHVKKAVESIGKLVFWRMAIKPGRPVAMGVIDGVPFIGLPGNPVASFVTQAYVVRPAALALMGAHVPQLITMPVRAAFSYKKKSGRREFVRAHLRRTDNGECEAIKFAREGAGLLSSMVATDGLLELADDVTRVEPGDHVGFIAYELLF